MQTCVSECIDLIFFLLVVLSITCSWLPNTLFLVDTGIFLWNTTSCRPCHRTFLPGFHRFGECACCFSWLSTAILRLSESVDFLSFLDMYLPVFLVLLVCVCVCLCHGVHRQTNRHSREISEIGPAQTRALEHMQRSLAHPWAAVVTSVTLIRSRSAYTHIHRHTSMYVCLFVLFRMSDSWLVNSDSFSLLIKSYIPTCILLCLCMYIFVLFLFVFSEYTLQLVA
jgi:hypothetical protein